MSDQAFDFFGAMLLEYEAEAKEAEIVADVASGNTAAYDEFVAHSRQRNLNAVASYTRKEKWRGYRKPLKVIGQVAAIAVITLALAVAAVAGSRTVRVRVMQLLASREAEYTELTMEEDSGASFEIPAEWLGENYPSFIPAGMEVDGISSHASFSTVEYRDSVFPEKRFNFAEYSEASVTLVDTEDAELRGITVRGNPAVLYTEDNGIGIYWEDGRRYFVLSAENLEEATVIRIAESVVRIN